MLSNSLDQIVTHKRIILSSKPKFNVNFLSNQNIFYGNVANEPHYSRFLALTWNSLGLYESVTSSDIAWIAAPISLGFKAMISSKFNSTRSIQISKRLYILVGIECPIVILNNLVYSNRRWRRHCGWVFRKRWHVSASMSLIYCIF